MELPPVLPEALIRFGAFLAVFAAVALWEVLRPCRVAARNRARRWRDNVTLGLINVMIVRALFPLAAVGGAATAAAHGWGLLNYAAPDPVLAVPIAFVALDFAIWLQHRLFHVFPVLWRLHRVHHADVEFDVSTGIRFHPLEIVVSLLVKMLVVVLIGAPVVAVIAFELVLSATSLFTHANARLPARLEPWVRWIVVTPDMHRIHHSTAGDEMNSNFGFNLSLWDRVFGTYRDEPRERHATMAIGLPLWRGLDAVTGLLALLGMPFRRDPEPAASDAPSPVVQSPSGEEP